MKFWHAVQDPHIYPNVYKTKKANLNTLQNCGAGVMLWSTDGGAAKNTKTHWKEGTTMQFSSGFRLYESKESNTLLAEADTMAPFEYTLWGADDANDEHDGTEKCPWGEFKDSVWPQPWLDYMTLPAQEQGISTVSDLEGESIH